MYAVALFAAMLTAFYMFRLLFVTFTGTFRGTEARQAHVHESPAAMTIPLIILAILSVIGGLAGIPEVFVHGGDKLGEFLSPVIKPVAEANISHTTEYMLMGLSTGLVLIMVFYAWIKFKNFKSEEAGGFGKVLENKWYVDELYDKIIVNPLNRFAGFLKDVMDKSVIDGLVNGVGKAVNYGSRQLRLLQSGQVGNYVLLMVISMLLIFIFQFFLRK
jgi:NADH-quinone oxidoreductase subunit L